MKSLSLAALEQIVTSAGNFMFMIIGVRVLGITDFGVVAYLWSIVQFPLSIYTALVLLPISSFKDSEGGAIRIFRHSIFISLWIFIFSIVFSAIITVISKPKFGNNDFEFFFYLLFWIFIQLLYELIRWLNLRFGDIYLILFTSAIRWIVFFSLLFFIGLNDSINIKSFLLLNFLCIAGWILSNLLLKIKLINNDILQPKFEAKIFSSGYPILFSAMTNSGVSLILNTLITRWYSIDLVGAIQAYKAIANSFNPISQFIDNQVTAFHAKKGKAVIIDSQFFSRFIYLMISITMISFLIKDYISIYILNGQYINYSMLFPILIFGAGLHLMARPVASQMRLSGNEQIFIFSSTITFLLILPLSILFLYLNKILIAVLISLTGPLVLILSYKLKGS